MEAIVLNFFILLGKYPIDMSEKTDIQGLTLSGLLADIKKGEIRIPDFQRAYIWNRDQVLELLESVWNGYPLGSILLWKTKMDLQERDPLNLNLPSSSPNSTRKYLLDGQQRLVSLYEVIHGNLLLGGKRKTKYHAFFDLDKKEFVIVSEKELNEAPLNLEDGFLPLNKLFSFTAELYPEPNAEIIRRLAGTSERIVTFTNLYTAFTSLKFPAIINGESLSVACSIFEKLNNTGTQLTVADLMVAITYAKDFNLREELANFNEQLDNYYFALKPRTILQCISACLQQGTERNHIIDSADEIQSQWKKTTESINLAIDFLKKHCSVPTSNFLPYQTILAPLTQFFYLHGNKRLSKNMIKRLQKYFWLSMFSGRYSYSQNSRAKEDIGTMEKVVANVDEQLFDYYDFTINQNVILDVDMSFNSSFAKVILCFLASREPKEFKNNEIVKLDQTFGESNQKQLHHIFPVNFLKTSYKKDQKTFENKIKPLINNVANISLISKATNREIWDKDPKSYFKVFCDENLNIAESLRSHLIFNIDDFGVSSNDFLKFIEKRAEVISAEINNFAEQLKKY